MASTLKTHISILTIFFPTRRFSETVAFMESSAADMLVKVLVFALVQGLVFLILKSSSDVFSKNKMRSLSFKLARSASIRRILAVISDLPAGGQMPSPSSRGVQSPSTEEYATADEDKD